MEIISFFVFPQWIPTYVYQLKTSSNRPIQYLISKKFREIKFLNFCFFILFSFIHKCHYNNMQEKKKLLIKRNDFQFRFIFMHTGERQFDLNNAIQNFIFMIHSIPFHSISFYIATFRIKYCWEFCFILFYTFFFYRLVSILL